MQAFDHCVVTVTTNKASCTRSILSTILSDPQHIDHVDLDVQ